MQQGDENQMNQHIYTNLIGVNKQISLKCEVVS